jgi:hypothetical protein
VAACRKALCSSGDLVAVEDGTDRVLASEPECFVVLDMITRADLWGTWWVAEQAGMQVDE